jgi:hypothetical protein
MTLCQLQQLLEIGRRYYSEKDDFYHIDTYSVQLDSDVILSYSMYVHSTYIVLCTMYIVCMYIHTISPTNTATNPKSQLTSPTPAQLPAVAVSTGHIVYITPKRLWCLK